MTPSIRQQAAVEIHPGMIVMGYADCGTNQIQHQQMLLVQRLGYDEQDLDQRYGYWEVRYLFEELAGDAPIGMRAWFVDEQAPPEVMFAAPRAFDAEEWTLGEETSA